MHHTAGKLEMSYEVGIAHFRIVGKTKQSRSLFMAEMREDDAKFIVRAWNNHHELFNALVTLYNVKVVGAKTLKGASEAMALKAIQNANGGPYANPE